MSELMEEALCVQVNKWIGEREPKEKRIREPAQNGVCQDFCVNGICLGHSRLLCQKRKTGIRYTLLLAPTVSLANTDSPHHTCKCQRST